MVPRGACCANRSALIAAAVAIVCSPLYGQHATIGGHEEIYSPLQLLVAPNKNDPSPLVLYHGRNCPDGFGAALAAWLYYGDSAEYLGLDHGDIKTVDDLPR